MRKLITLPFFLHVVDLDFEDFEIPSRMVQTRSEVEYWKAVQNDDRSQSEEHSVRLATLDLRDNVLVS